MSVPRFFAPDATADRTSVQLPSDEASHLVRVLRLERGARVRVFDGRGREWDAHVEAVRRAHVDVALDAEVAAQPEPRVRVTLAVGILKGDQMDRVVRDATMLGAAAIAPMRTAHVVVTPRAWASGTVVDRWRRIAVSSAKQCGRAVVPEILPVRDVSEWLAEADAGSTWIAVEPAAASLLDPAAFSDPPPPRALVLIGPEGGWSPGELALAADCRVRPLHFGVRTLRAESVPLVALSVLWTMWGWDGQRAG